MASSQIAGISLPPLYREVLEYQQAIIEQQPFDDSGVFQHGQICCTKQQHGGQSHVICLACHNLLKIVRTLLDPDRKDEARLTSYGRIPLCHTLADLWRSAESGCHMCAVLKASSLKYLVDGKPASLDRDVGQLDKVRLVIVLTGDPSSSLRCEMTLMLCGHTYAYSSRHIQLSFNDEDALDAQPQSPWVDSTGDENAIQLATKWLQTCRDSHPGCVPPSNANPSLPKRLLKLDDTSVRVVLNNGHHFVALSHCWGDQSKMPKLLDEDLSNAIFEVSSLPKTFQDAVNVTKRFGMQYLWIDSLCIVQTSKKDWLEESAVMADIYAHSEFTIAALASSNGSQGCFRDLAPLMTTPLEVDGLTVQIGNVDNFYHLEVVGTDNYISPLHKRGWVVQERIWAPRTIFFGDLGLHWECRTLQTSQACHQPYTGAAPLYHHYKLMLRNLFSEFTSPDDQPDTSGYGPFQETWYRLLEIYTSCLLTFHTDRLPALMGIANAISRNNQEKYTQGLWEKYLTEDLLWRPSHDRPGAANIQRCSRPKLNNPFPSWSWASLHGAIFHLYPVGKVTWRAEVTLHQDDTLIKLTTYTAQVQLNDVDNLMLKHAIPGNADINDDFIWYVDDESDTPTDMTIALVQRRLASQTPFQELLDCLVLAPSQNATFRRVGVCRIRNDSHEDPFTGLITGITIS